MKKENVVTNNLFCPSSSRSVSVRNTGAAPHLYPALQPCGMTKCVARGFTLIELLVVVLIIGILSAVALPQYQKAVEKAKLTEVLTNVKAIKTGMELSILENGNFINNQLSDYILDLQGGSWTCDGLPCTEYITKHIYYNGCYCNANDSCYCEIMRCNHCNGNGGQQENLWGIVFSKSEITGNWEQQCFTEKTTIGKTICKSLETLGWQYNDEKW